MINAMALDFDILNFRFWTVKYKHLKINIKFPLFRFTSFYSNTFVSSKIYDKRDGFRL